MEAFWAGFEKQAGQAALRKVVVHAQSSWNPLAKADVRERLGGMMTKHLKKMKDQPERYARADEHVQQIRRALRGVK